MLFKKNNLISSKDQLADSYLDSLKEQREKLRAKTQEIKECLKADFSCECDENHSDSQDTNGTK